MFGSRFHLRPNICDDDEYFISNIVLMVEASVVLSFVTCLRRRPLQLFDLFPVNYNCGLHDHILVEHQVLTVDLIAHATVWRALSSSSTQFSPVKVIVLSISAAVRCIRSTGEFPLGFLTVVGTAVIP